MSSGKLANINAIILFQIEFADKAESKRYILLYGILWWKLNLRRKFENSITAESHSEQCFESLFSTVNISNVS